MKKRWFGSELVAHILNSIGYNGCLNYRDEYLKSAESPESVRASLVVAQMRKELEEHERKLTVRVRSRRLKEALLKKNLRFIG